MLPFENRTEDPSVAACGRMAADRITQGLQRTGLVEVIDATAATRLATDTRLADPEGRGGPDLQRLAERTGAATIVLGTFARQGEDIIIRAQVTDARDGTVARTLDPVHAASGDPGLGLEELRTRVAGALASLVDERIAALRNPPRRVPSTGWQRRSDGRVAIRDPVPQTA